MTTEPTLPILQIVWHSRTGACRQLARAAARAAAEEARSDEGQKGVERHQLAEVRITSPCKDSAGSTSVPGNAAGSASWTPTAPEDGAQTPSFSDRVHAVGAPTVVIRCDHARRVGTASMLEATGYLFIAPENLASMAGVMKDFFDRQYYPLLDRIQGRPAAVIVAAGSDGQGAVRQIERILTGWRLRLAAESLIVRVEAQTPEAILAPKHLSAQQLAPAADLGRALAAGLALGIF